MECTGVLQVMVSIRLQTFINGPVRINPNYFSLRPTFHPLLSVQMEISLQQFNQLQILTELRMWYGLMEQNGKVLVCHPMRSIMELYVVIRAAEYFILLLSGVIRFSHITIVRDGILWMIQLHLLNWKLIL